MRMIATPLESSPDSMARWIGAAPRQRGNSEAWMLTQPRRGISNTRCGNNKP